MGKIFTWLDRRKNETDSAYETRIGSLAAFHAGYAFLTLENYIPGLSAFAVHIVWNGEFNSKLAYPLPPSGFMLHISGQEAEELIRQHKAYPVYVSCFCRLGRLYMDKLYADCGAFDHEMYYNACEAIPPEGAVFEAMKADERLRSSGLPAKRRGSGRRFGRGSYLTGSGYRFGKGSYRTGSGYRFGQGSFTTGSGYRFGRGSFVTGSGYGFGYGYGSGGSGYRFGRGSFVTGSGYGFGYGYGFGGSGYRFGRGSFVTGSGYGFGYGYGFGGSGYRFGQGSFVTGSAYGFGRSSYLRGSYRRGSYRPGLMTEGPAVGMIAAPAPVWRNSSERIIRTSPRIIEELGYGLGLI
ncbi:MAG: hypothetical protein IKI75_07550 [Lachnospiraceae bacterium]|nr:hypothetical protein [Lachnospiraceae bacterium]